MVLLSECDSPVLLIFKIFYGFLFLYWVSRYSLFSLSYVKPLSVLASLSVGIQLHSACLIDVSGIWT